MIIAFGLLAAMILIGFAAPRYLSVTVAPGLNPRLALTAWTTSVVLTLAALIAAPLSMLTSPGRTTFGAAHACLGQLRENGSLPWLDAGQVVLTVASTGMALILVGAISRRLLARRRFAAQHLREIALVADTAVDPSLGSHRGVPIMWIDAPEPVYYSVGGERPTIVASHHLIDLPPEQRRAVLDHEVAHLRGHHHILIAAAEALAATAPIMPLFRAAPGAARTLVEFAADHHAAARNGAASVGDALVTVHTQSVGTSSAASTRAPAGAPAMTLALSREAVTARLYWLTIDPNRRQRLCAPMDYPVALAVALVPLALSVTTMLITAALICLQMQH